MKHGITTEHATEVGVAPFAGAWIETYRFEQSTASGKCRPLRGGVD